MNRLLLLVVLLTGCPPGPVAPTDTDACAAAEATLLKLQCKDSRGELLGGKNKSGVGFTDRCKNIQDNSAPLNPSCLAKIITCEEIDGCFRSL